MVIRKMDDKEEEESTDYKNGKLISSIKPNKDDYQEKQLVDKDEYWTSIVETSKAFADQGFSIATYNFEVLGGNRRKLGGNIGAENFFAKVDITKEAIEQKITIMHRQRAVEYYREKGSNKEKSRVKEFLTYRVELEGVDFLGNPIRASLECEGLCYDPERRVRITQNEDSEDRSPRAEFVLGKIRQKYYIPFTKKAVDDLLKKTNTDKDTVNYYGKIGNTQHGMGFRCSGYTYDQFVNTTWEEFEALGRRPEGPSGVSKWKAKKPEVEFIG